MFRLVSTSDDKAGRVFYMKKNEIALVTTINDELTSLMTRDLKHLSDRSVPILEKRILELESFVSTMDECEPPSENAELPAKQAKNEPFKHKWSLKRQRARLRSQLDAIEAQLEEHESVVDEHRLMLAIKRRQLNHLRANVKTTTTTTKAANSEPATTTTTTILSTASAGTVDENTDTEPGEVRATPSSEASSRAHGTSAAYVTTLSSVLADKNIVDKTTATANGTGPSSGTRHFAAKK